MPPGPPQLEERGQAVNVLNSAVRVAMPNHSDTKFRVERGNCQYCGRPNEWLIRDQAGWRVGCRKSWSEAMQAAYEKAARNRLRNPRAKDNAA